METSTERMQILEMIESGRITTEEGLSLLKALVTAEQEMEQVEQYAEPKNRSTPSEENQQAQNLDSQSEPSPNFYDAESDDKADRHKWKNWWMIPLWVGTAVTVFGGTFMYLALRASGLGFWFICATIPFVSGLGIILLAYHNRYAPWLHLRLQQQPGKTPEHLAFSFPLPMRTAAWFMRRFGWLIPETAGHYLDLASLVFAKNSLDKNPISILVGQKETGEKVEIYIG